MVKQKCLLLLLLLLTEYHINVLTFRVVDIYVFIMDMQPAHRSHLCSKCSRCVIRYWPT